MPLTFRRAGVADAAPLAELVNAAYRGDASRAGWTSEADLLDGQRTDADLLAAELAEPGVEQYVACDENAAVVGTFRWEPDPHGGGDGYVGLITVAPARQGRGIGAELIVEAERITRERGCPGLVLWVIEQRAELRAFYARRGFLDTGQREPFPYDHPEFGVPRVEQLRFAVLRKPLD